MYSMCIACAVYVQDVEYNAAHNHYRVIIIILLSGY